MEKAREFCKKKKKTHTKKKHTKKTAFASLTMPGPLTVQIITHCGKFLRRWEYQNTLSASYETCIQVKKQQLEVDMEQWTGSKLEKEYVNAVYCHSS